MRKEQVFIVLNHKHSFNARKNEWEVTETVEFVNQLRNRHYQFASAIGDYLNRKMIIGAKIGMDIYEKFEPYIRTKYAKQLSQLDAAYKDEQVPITVEDTSVEISDEFGNVRARTVFDTV